MDRKTQKAEPGRASKRIKFKCKKFSCLKAKNKSSYARKGGANELNIKNLASVTLATFIFTIID